MIPKVSNLTRNYSIASLLGIALVAVTLVYFYQSMAVKALIDRESQSNSDLARTIGNIVWPKYSHFFMQADSMPIERFAGSTEIKEINEDILHKVQGLRVVKVKIYDLNGMVIFSTQPSQIGDNKSESTAFQAARDGYDASEIIFRNTFSSYEGSIYDRNLVASYVPIRSSFDEPVEGVFEIYSDVTPLLNDIDKTSTQILVVITALMLVLFLFLMVIVRRAHIQIEAHELAQEREQHRRLDYLEYHDEVSGLLNRKGLLRRMQHCMTEERAGDVGVGVIALKLLNLSAISGGLGHKRLLYLLRLAAERVKSCSSGEQNLSHLNSGEFVLIVENLFSESELEFLTEKLGQLFAEPFSVDDNSVTLSVAMGADCSWGGKSHETLVNNALLALGECKVQGRQFLRYEEGMELRKRESLNLEMEICRALKNKEFTLYYQPKINLHSGEVAGMEALVRWHHPKRGLVMPGVFIDLLERRGYIVELGQWLLQQACEQCKRWHDEGRRDLRVAVNVSVKQLQSSGFVQSVDYVLAQSGLEPEFLELELTESILVADTEVVLELLQRLKKLGVQLSIDDFGTGYSSLSYLMHFPFDHIKIDRSFIRDMMHNHDHAVLTSAIITMAKSLKLGVVAEGVETQEQLERVREMGCDEVQGFYFSQAVEAVRFTDVMRNINASGGAGLSH
jgi:EAL domain-containing protein (putative c-di-GMP-specific phosphodiesterase class I)/GGDEF domain-containing protein